MLGYEVARIIGAELAHGFMTTFARYDLTQLLDLCGRIGATTVMIARVAEMVDFVERIAGAIRPVGIHGPAAGLALGDIRSAALAPPAQGGEPEEWISREPCMLFQAYPQRRKRY